MTIGTRIMTWFRGELVATDSTGKSTAWRSANFTVE